MPCAGDSAPHELTRQFYAWEKRGRGWQVYPDPVAIEPPFRPFWGHYLAAPPPAARDDGRKPTFLSALFDRLATRNAGPPPLPTPPEDEPEVDGVGDEGPLVEMQAALPAETKVTD